MGQMTIFQRVLVLGIPLLFGVVVHEVAHGWVANRLGDKTAKVLGRLTLNPLKHIDLVGTIVIPFLTIMLGGVVFGWAKPVPVNFNNLHKPKRDMAFVAAAGPLANFVMALIWAVVAKISLLLLQNNVGWVMGFYLIGKAGIIVNILLMLLNLLPIPPLDGSRIVSSFLPVPAAEKYNRIERFGIWILLLLIVTRVLFFVLSPPLIFLVSLFNKMFGLI